jgi:hypothetical protein
MSGGGRQRWAGAGGRRFRLFVVTVTHPPRSPASLTRKYGDRGGFLIPTHVSLQTFLRMVCPPRASLHRIVPGAQEGRHFSAGFGTSLVMQAIMFL